MRRPIPRGRSMGWALARVAGSVAVLAVCLSWADGPSPQRTEPPAAPPTAFATTVQPFFAKNCYGCHNERVQSGGLNLAELKDAASITGQSDIWEKVVEKLETGQMPPKAMPRPDPEAVKAVTVWIRGEFDRAERLAPADPGRITARRLNRAEYNNSIRDLLGVDWRPANEFPQDDSGYGFDDIGDVLSLSPVLMEKYMAAAEKVVQEALLGPGDMKPTLTRYQPPTRRRLESAGDPVTIPPYYTLNDYDTTGLALPAALHLTHLFPVEGDYDFGVVTGRNRPRGAKPIQLAIWIDGQIVATITVDNPNGEAEAYQSHAHVTAGEHWVAASFPRYFEGLPAAYGGPNPVQPEGPQSLTPAAAADGGGRGRGQRPAPPEDSQSQTPPAAGTPAAAAAGGARGRGQRPAPPQDSQSQTPPAAGSTPAAADGGGRGRGQRPAPPEDSQSQTPPAAGTPAAAADGGGRGRGQRSAPPQDSQDQAAVGRGGNAVAAAGAGGQRPAPPPQKGQGGGGRGRLEPADALKVNLVEIIGPFNFAKEPTRESLQKIYVCGHLDGKHVAGCDRRIVSSFAKRAFRRPVTAPEIAPYLGLMTKAEKQGRSFEDGLALALRAILVSPDFLFRIESGRAAASSSGAVAASPITQYELATRLSYFLWSSTPDTDLLHYADLGTLRQPAVLAAQVRRMLKDPKADALVENFGGQWLQFRSLESVTPDRDRFPDFEDYLRMSMKKETELFFEHILREDRSILDFIDGKYTFLNERLASHYGIPGVIGPEFRKVDLTGTERGGILTQGSVLTVSSYPNRTSPVLRGKWILENLLNTPPPPPPPDVPLLDEASVGSTASLREQLEKHRASAVCSSCHSRMDPLGFGLENFDAVGAWRTLDGKVPIDASGTLPNGKSFQGASGLEATLRDGRDAFTLALTDKLLTYALGRGLERYDKRVVKEIASRVAARDYRFSSLVLEIVDSLPFQMRRGTASATSLAQAGAAAGISHNR